jgi:hypothetical protein
MKIIILYKREGRDPAPHIPQRKPKLNEHSPLCKI